VAAERRTAHTIVGWTALAAAALLCARGQAQEGPARERSAGDRLTGESGEITPRLRLGVARGLELLKRKQQDDGDMSSHYPTAINALVGLAFLAGGYSERAGSEHSETIRRLTTAILRRQNRHGYFDDGIGLNESEKEPSKEGLMYGHGFATLYLAELYGTSTHRQAEIREALVKALKVIEGSQGAIGGWDYYPASRFGAEGGPFGAGDTSITVCQTMALRAAKNIGIKIEEDVISRARKYIERAQNSDGGFRYRQHGEEVFFQTGSAFPRSAAGVCILYSLGEYNTTKIKAGFDYLHRTYRFPWSNEFPYYGHYYCAQAMFQAGGKYWKEYFPWIREELLSKQLHDGSWPEHRREGAIQGTAMALIVLQLPYRFLPIHER